MSRIGKLPVTIPAGVKVDIKPEAVFVEGPKGKLSQHYTSNVTIEMKDGVVHVNPVDESKAANAAQGLYRNLLNNMVIGVTNGFSKSLIINGVGFRAEVKGNQLVMNLGYSHQVEMEEIDGITIDVPQPNQIIISGPDKQKVGQFAANVREKRPPEPYKGKGIKYVDEHIRRKEGKAGSKK